MDQEQPFDLGWLGSGEIPAVSSKLGNSLAEAAAICLEHNRHTSGVTMTSLNGRVPAVPIVWPQVTDQAHRSWRDLERATEDGAMGLGVLLIERFTEYTCIERAPKGNGNDWWLASKESLDSEFPFQKAARLENSGILNGTDADIQRRKRQKVERINAYSNRTPAEVVIIEFGRPSCLMESI